MEPEAAIRQGVAHEKAGELSAAEALYRAVLDEARGSGNPHERAACLNLARLSANDGREFEGLALSYRASALAASAGDGWSVSLARQHLATALFGIEDYERVARVLDQVRSGLDGLPPDQRARARLSLTLHHARLAAALGDVRNADAALEAANEASLVATGGPVSPRVAWFVHVVSRNASGRHADAEPWFASAPPAEGIVRRQLEVDEQRTYCLVGLRPRTDGVAAATALLTALRDAPSDTVGCAWRLRVASRVGTALSASLGPCDAARLAWDIAGQALLSRVAQLDACVQSLPEVATVDRAVYTLLAEYRVRFRRQHERLLREVQDALSQAPIGAPLLDVSDGHVVVCAWCARVKAAAGHWMPIRQFLPPDDGGFVVSHGICLDCWSQMAP